MVASDSGNGALVPSYGRVSLLAIFACLGDQKCHRRPKIGPRGNLQGPGSPEFVPGHSHFTIVMSWARPKGSGGTLGRPRSKKAVFRPWGHLGPFSAISPKWGLVHHEGLQYGLREVHHVSKPGGCTQSWWPQIRATVRWCRVTADFHFWPFLPVWGTKSASGGQKSGLEATCRVQGHLNLFQAIHISQLSCPGPIKRVPEAH